MVLDQATTQNDDTCGEKNGHKTNACVNSKKSVALGTAIPKIIPVLRAVSTGRVMARTSLAMSWRTTIWAKRKTRSEDIITQSQRRHKASTKARPTYHNQAGVLDAVEEDHVTNRAIGDGRGEDGDVVL